jgi:hypothetical protein
MISVSSIKNSSKNSPQLTQVEQHTIQTLSNPLDEARNLQSQQFASKDQFFPLVSCGLNEVSGGVHNVPRSVANLGKYQERYNEDQSDCFHFVW